MQTVPSRWRAQHLVVVMVVMDSLAVGAWQRVIPVRKKCARIFALTLVMVVVGLPAGAVCNTMNAVRVSADRHIVMTASMAKNTTFITVKIAMSQLVSIANLLVRKLGVDLTART